MKNSLEMLLESRGISKSELARDLGITRQTVINISKGKNPSIKVAMLIADYFGKEVSDIFFAPNVKQVLQKHSA